MQRQSIARTASAKRKRRSSDNCSNIENEPIANEEKRPREDRTHSDDGDGSSDDRLPLTELSILRLASGKERLDNSRLETDAERLQLQTPDETDDEIPVFPDIGLTPEKQTSFLTLSAEDILAEGTSQPSTSLDSAGYLPTLSPLGRCKKFGNRQCPLPELCWTDEVVLWNHFCNKDIEDETKRDPVLFLRHPNLQPRMRAVLLEWIIEVCDVYKLHRETYYLAMDYLDRYLGLTRNVPKVQLQLIGISCLLIASKVEEIYPPKVSEFAYVTDGACSEDDIIKMELIIVKTLNWKCTVITANSWLCIYIQLCYLGNARNNMELAYPQYPSELFSKIAQLLDLSTLDVQSLKYPYGILAAACVALAISKNHALTVSGFCFADISECVNWMAAFWEAIQEEKNNQEEELQSGTLPPGPSKTSPIDFSHTLQTHTISLDLLETGQSILELRTDSGPSNIGLLTPPSSSKK